VLSHATVRCAHFHYQKAKRCLATMVTLLKLHVLWICIQTEHGIFLRMKFVI